jgi:predicted ABC-type ATPase
VDDRGGRPCIYVLAGTNGAGKSSIAGAMFLSKGAEYFNPDEVAERIRAIDGSLTVS